MSNSACTFWDAPECRVIWYHIISYLPNASSCHFQFTDIGVIGEIGVTVLRRVEVEREIKRGNAIVLLHNLREIPAMEMRQL